MAEDTLAGSSTTAGSPRASPSKSMSPVKSPRKMSEDPPVPAKRTRTINTEERARSKRMFGNILGTLRRFQDDDKSKRSSEAARRREETSQRIAARLASETNLQHDITSTERELRTLKLATENAAYVLEHREVALTARHNALRVSARYLHTSTPSADSVFETSTLIYPSAPVPLARGPSRTAPGAPALYYLPKVLLPEQEDMLQARQEEILKIIEDESEALRADKADLEETASSNADKIADLTAKLQKLKEQQASARRASVGGRGGGKGEEPALSGNGERDYDMESRHGDDDSEVAY